MKEGIVYLPYIMVEHTDESLKEYKKFMTEYERKHKYCPKCGGTSYSTTFVGYILNSEKRDEYKDLNSCKCQDCGNVHTKHERVKIKKKLAKLKK